MEWLNYHHLLYFWTVAKEGSVSRAAHTLRLSQPTVSAQVRQLEHALGSRLFQKQGRSLVLTDTGRLVFGYADEIFGIGRELLQTLRGRPSGRAPQLTVGVVNAVPKLIVYRLLRPAMDVPTPPRLVCREDHADRLLSQLATHGLDVVISDAPAPPHVRVKVFNHLLGESDTTFFAPARVAARLRRGFPQSLRHARILLPTSNTPLRGAIDQWFQHEGLHPSVIGEFEDSALMKAFGHGTGVVFPSPTVIEKEVCHVYGVRPVGRTHAVKERYYAISVERRLTHAGVVAITSAARGGLFNAGTPLPSG